MKTKLIAILVTLLAVGVYAEYFSEQTLAICVRPDIKRPFVLSMVYESDHQPQPLDDKGRHYLDECGWFKQTTNVVLHSTVEPVVIPETNGTWTIRFKQ